MYRLFKKTREIYNCLQDEISRNTFWARLAVDTEPSMQNTMQLLQLNPHFSQEELEQIRSWRKQIEGVYQKGKKILLYGTGGRGQLIGKLLLQNGIMFDGFCGQRGPAAFPDGLLGKPVVAPDYLCQHSDEFYVAISVGPVVALEIMQFLTENNFPKDHILDIFQWSAEEKLYFEFPSLYRKGTVFVDAGCLNCADDYRFVDWCNGEYSSIIAFEPEPDGYAECLRQTERHEIRDIRIVQAGLSDKSGVAEFAIQGTGASHMIQSGSKELLWRGRVQGQTTIKTVALDDMVMQTVGFIKMDIEGAEFDALHGAKNTIIRDKPFLAISIYHRPGDMLAIMDYLHELVPEYRFWIRHYGPLAYETVLYASTDKMMRK